MIVEEKDFPSLIKEIRRQLGISQEDLARKLGVSFTSINRWENGQVKPSKLAQKQLDIFCSQMTRQKKLKLSEGTK